MASPHLSFLPVYVTSAARRRATPSGTEAGPTARIPADLKVGALSFGLRRSTHGRILVVLASHCRTGKTISSPTASLPSKPGPISIQPSSLTSFKYTRENTAELTIYPIRRCSRGRQDLSRSIT